VTLPKWSEKMKEKKKKKSLLVEHLGVDEVK
jgi:hypothetical protein